MIQERIQDIVDPDDIARFTLDPDFISAGYYFAGGKSGRKFVYIPVLNTQEINQCDVFQGNYFFYQRLMALRPGIGFDIKFLLLPEQM
jgi:hypothetical protein